MTEGRDHLRALIEAAIYAAPEPVPLKSLARATSQPTEHLQELLDSLMAEYGRPDHGVRLCALAGRYAIGTKPELGAELKKLVADLRPPKPLSTRRSKPRLSLPLLQLVTAQEVQLARKGPQCRRCSYPAPPQAYCARGRARTRGKPLQYRTTPQCLIEFGLTNLSELPNKRFSRFQELKPAPIRAPPNLPVRSQ